MASRQSARVAKVYRRRRFYIGALAAVLVLLFTILVVVGINTWTAYDETFGARNAGKDWLNRKVSSYSVDAYDTLLALKRLQIQCLRFSSGKIHQAEFNIQRRQVASAVAAFGPTEFLGKEFSTYKSFPDAYAEVIRFLDAAKDLEAGSTTGDAVFKIGETAALAWGLVTVESIKQEFQFRDRMEEAIVDFRPLAVRAFFITSILTTLCLALFAVAAYAAWRAVRSERRRFDHFELLLSTVGHDLRSPLQSLVGAAKLAAADAIPSERMKFVRIVHERSAFFTRLLDDLINLARDESLTFEPIPIDLTGWFEATEARYRRAATEKGLTFVSTLTAPQPEINFDMHRLTQCTDNLVSNAIRYTSTGSVEFHVTCTFPPDVAALGTLVLEVKDTGQGIAAADQERIFEPFVRLVGEVKGMGVGLTMVSNFAQSIGGTIAVSSELAAGSAFTFSAPVEAASALVMAAANVESHRRQSKAEQPAAEQSPAQVPRVLVVDDDPVILEVVAGLMPLMGFDSDIAAGSADGLAMAHSGSYCAVLTDIQMPGLDGFELAETLRRELHPCPSLIAMTAYTRTPSADKRARIFDAMLTKPFDEEALLQLLDAAAERWERFRNRTGPA